MDVEIDDRDPLESVDGSGVRSADRDVIEQAEPHRLNRPGVMSRGPYRAKGIPGRSGSDGVDSGAYSAGGSQSGFTGSAV